VKYSIHNIPAPVASIRHDIGGPVDVMVQPDTLKPATFRNRIYAEGSVELWEDEAGLMPDDPAILPMMTRYCETFVAPLWQAATDWQERYISGLAGGLLVIGVMQQKPISLAIMQWSGDLWSEYYRRKAVIMAGGNADYDFSTCGEMPYSVPELRAELGL